MKLFSHTVVVGSDDLRSLCIPEEFTGWELLSLLRSNKDKDQKMIISFLGVSYLLKLTEDVFKEVKI